RLRTELPRQRQPALVEVDREHPAAVRAEQLHGQQANESSPGDDECLAQGRLREANSLQADRTHHGESCGFVAHTFRNAHAQVPRHRYDLRARTVGGHAIALSQSLYPLPHVTHGTDIAVTEGDRLAELGADRLDGSEQAVGPHLVEDLRNLLRLPPRLCD